MINVIRYIVYLSSTNNVFLYYVKFVSYFHAVQTQYMLFWLLKDA